MVLITRREFTMGVGGAVAGLALSRLSAAGAELQIGVQSYTFRAFNLDKMIEIMRSLDLSSVELWDGHLDPAKSSEADYRAARGKLDAAGIKVSAYCVNFKPDASNELLDKSFKGAGLLGTSIMTTSTEKAIVPKLDEWCNKYGVTIGLHNHWLGDKWFKGNKQQNFEGPADWAEALKGRSKRIAINLDIGHFSAAGYDPVAYFKEQKDRIVSLHVKDRDKDAEHTYRHFGKGAVPIAQTLRAARDAGFKYAVNIEYEMDEQDPIDGVRESYTYLKDVLAKA